MTEHRIHFKPEMSRAILAGRKTQTRRICKQLTHGYPQFAAYDGQMWYDDNPWVKCQSPYGVPGDMLWVRETFWQLKQPLLPDGEGPLEWVNKPECIHYAEHDWGGYNPAEFGYYKRPSIHMPRWASRITLEVTGIRVEQVQEITEEDAKAEGAEQMHLDDLGQTFKTYRRGFQSLWDSINLARGYGWDTNPWCWTVTFRRIA